MGYLYVQSNSSDSVFHVGFLHCLFLYCVITHLRLCLASSLRLPVYQYVKSWSPIARRMPALRLQLPTACYTPFEDDAISSLVYACDPQGTPERCWRDRCRGHWKPPKMRHCRLCGECRFFFDHHCPWFNNDIVAPTTLLPFLVLTGVTPVLVLLACRQLVYCTWIHVRTLWHLGHEVPILNDWFWTNRWTWVLGPVCRPLVGLFLASFHVEASPYGNGDIFSTSDPRPTFRLPLALLLACILSIITASLCLSTMRQLWYGNFTVDTERARSLAKLQKRVGLSPGLQLKKRSLKPPEYFWVPQKQSVVHVSPDLSAHMYNDDRSWMSNIRRYLGLSSSNPFEFSPKFLHLLLK